MQPLKNPKAILTWKDVYDMLFSEISKLQNIMCSMSPFVFKKLPQIAHVGVCCVCVYKHF